MRSLGGSPARGSGGFQQLLRATIQLRGTQVRTTRPSVRRPVAASRRTQTRLRTRPTTRNRLRYPDQAPNLRPTPTETLQDRLHQGQYFFVFG